MLRMIKHFGFLSLVLGLFLSVNAQSWVLKIKPLKTNIAELSELAKLTPERLPSNALFYRLKQGNLILDLSTGKCEETVWGSWNTKEGTVLDVVFYPRKGKPINIHLSKDKMVKGYDHGHITYVNDEVGLYYSILRGKFSEIHIYPPKNATGSKCESLESPYFYPFASFCG